MQFQFDANQTYQLDAIQAIADLFTGQRRIEADLRFTAGRSLFAAVANRLDLTDDDLLANLHAVQRANGIALDPALECIEESIATAAGEETVRFYNFSVEMETGTGKTYVYLRTIFELNKRFGFTKFVIVVPSVAIKEGVYKALQITEEHFRGLYAGTPFDYFLYDSAKLGQVRNFATSSQIQVMVVTVGAISPLLCPTSRVWLSIGRLAVTPIKFSLCRFHPRALGSNSSAAFTYLPTTSS